MVQLANLLLGAKLCDHCINKPWNLPDDCVSRLAMLPIHVCRKHRINVLITQHLGDNRLAIPGTEPKNIPKMLKGGASLVDHLLVGLCAEGTRVYNLSTAVIQAIHPSAFGGFEYLDAALFGTQPRVFYPCFGQE